MNRKDLQELSRVRLEEAEALLAAGLFDGAYYLAGYAVECAIKACIAKSTRRHDFPDKRKAESSYTHSLKELIRVADLEDSLKVRLAADPAFKANWESVQGWTEQSRYRRNDQRVADILVSAVRDRKHGIISWLRLHWWARKLTEALSSLKRWTPQS